MRGVCETAGNIAGGILFRRDEIKTEQDDDRKEQLAGDAFAEVVKEVEAAPYLTVDCKKIADDVTKTHLQKITAEFKPSGFATFIGKYLDVDKLLALSVSAFLKARWTDLETTGLVFARLREQGNLSLPGAIRISGAWSAGPSDSEAP